MARLQSEDLTRGLRVSRPNHGQILDDPPGLCLVTNCQIIHRTGEGRTTTRCACYPESGLLLPSIQSGPNERESVVARLIIAVVVGLAIAIGGTVLVVNVLSSHGSGTPSNSSTYNYGSR
jgi:hypothetical protein